LYAVKLARLSNIHPIIAIAGRGGVTVSPLLDLSKGDVLIDHRQDRSALIQEIRSKASNVEFALDSISIPETINLLGEVVDHNTGRIAIVLKPEITPEIPSGVKLPLVFAPALWEPIANDFGDQSSANSPYVGLKAFGYVYYRYLTYALSGSLIPSHPAEVVPGGLNGIPTGLKNLRDGVKSGVKFLFKVEDTEGV
jgi:NADPH2:quinone reductase